ncbi:hypothetical protein ABZ608_14020 [Streptomyces sp. NPDC013172]|uniref:hypothetical protein n=1 Tax=Streptomyces sp. NPDC013172 TaxID=3155009 RepID=UPI00340634D1
MPRRLPHTPYGLADGRGGEHSIRAVQHLLDESLHTDVGWDTFWSAPHMLLYGTILVTLGALARWA